MKRPERLLEILIDVTLGRKPPADELEEEAELRAICQRQVDEIRRNGGGIYIPHELP